MRMYKVIVVIVSVLAIAITATPQEKKGEAKGKIVFVYSDYSIGTEIYSIDVDGGNIKNLTNNGAIDESPAWSPDGKRIAFISTRGCKDNSGKTCVCVMDADGSNQKQLTNNKIYNSSPTWSPDGKKIVFVSYTYENKKLGCCEIPNIHASAIYTINIDGSNVKKLTDDKIKCYSPIWSPNSEKIVFSADYGGRHEDICTINSDGSNFKNLTNRFGYGRSPVWSPDGKKIAFIKESRFFHIFVIDSDGSNIKQLTAGVDNGCYGETIEEYSPVWSPDGKRIAFTVGSNTKSGFEMYIMDADGSNQKQLTNNGRGNSSPVWSPDGMKIVFVSSKDAYPTTHLYIMNPDGSNVKRLSEKLAGYEYSPAWSPVR